MNKEGFVFFPSFYDAYKAAKHLGKGEEYIDKMMAFAFEGADPTSDDVLMNALLSSFKPVIGKSLEDRRNGAKGGRPKKEKLG